MKYRCLVPIRQAKEGHIYKVLMTERKPDGDSVVTDERSGSNFKIKTAYLQDTQYFELVEGKKNV